MKSHTAKAFRSLCTAYPRWSEAFTPEMVEDWGQMLEEIPPDRLQPAIVRLIRTSRFAPSIADIFAAAGVKVAPAEDEFEDLRRSGAL